MPRPKSLFGKNIEKFGGFDHEIKFNPFVMDIVQLFSKRYATVSTLSSFCHFRNCFIRVDFVVFHPYNIHSPFSLLSSEAVTKRDDALTRGGGVRVCESV